MAAREARLRSIDESQIAGPPTDTPVVEPATVAVSSSRPQSAGYDTDPVGYALRADSPGAPSNYREAAATPDFPDAMRTEMENHRRNGTWTVIDRSEVPPERRLHNLTWVFKHKRCGKAKARLCVQGCTMVHKLTTIKCSQQLSGRVPIERSAPSPLPSVSIRLPYRQHTDCGNSN